MNIEIVFFDAGVQTSSDVSDVPWSSTLAGMMRLLLAAGLFFFFGSYELMWTSGRSLARRSPTPLTISAASRRGMTRRRDRSSARRRSA